MDLHKFLSHSFLFSSFTVDEIAKVVQFSSIKNLENNEILFSEGQNASAFFIVVSGRVKISQISAEGAEQILHIHNPGDLVAEASIFDRITYPANCSAIGKTARAAAC